MRLVLKELYHSAPLNVIPAWIVQVMQVSHTRSAPSLSVLLTARAGWRRAQPYLDLPG